MADTSRTVEIIFKGDDQVSGPAAAVQQSLAGIGEDAVFAEQSFSGLDAEFTAVGTASASSAASLGVLGKALGALGLGLAATDFISANVALERFTKTMEFATGSSTEAAREWEYASEVADRFGLEVEGLSNTYAQFIAGTKGGTLSTQELRETFEGVAGTLSLVGASSQDVEEALRQMTQGIGKNRFELEDLKSIAERVPGGMYAIADALSITTEELYKQITAGEFGAEQILIYAQSLNEGLNGVEFDGFINNTNRVKNAWGDLQRQFGETGAFDLIADGLGGIAALVKNIGQSFEFLGDLKFGSQILGDDVKAEIAEVRAAADEWSLLTGLFSNPFEDSSDKIKESSSQIVDSLTEIEVTAQRIPEPIRDYTAEAAASEVAFQKSAQAAFTLEKVEPFENIAKSAEKASAVTEKTRTDLERLASNERIKNIEAKISLDIANIEANAEIAVATIEGLSNTISSTGDLLGSLFGDLNEAEGLRQEFAIEDQIKLENELRKEAAELQERVAEAQIQNLNAKTKALQQGQAMIQIDGAGLQPHLEAFMFEILESIQVQVNSDGYDMLLGITP